MNIFLMLLLIAAMAATLYVLVRGVMTMAQGNRVLFGSPCFTDGLALAARAAV